MAAQNVCWLHVSHLDAEMRDLYTFSIGACLTCKLCISFDGLRDEQMHGPCYIHRYKPVNRRVI